MKNIVAVIGLLFAANASADNFEHCNALLQHGINDITRHQSAAHAIAYKYHQNCGMDFSSASDASAQKASVSVFGYGSGEAGSNSSQQRESLKKWCNTNKDFSESRQDLFQEASIVNQPALLAWNQCQEISKKKVNIKFIPQGEHSKFVHFEIDSTLDADLVFMGVKQTNFDCTANSIDLDGKAIQITRNIPIRNSNIQIDCTRASPTIKQQDGVGTITYDEGYIAINTSGPALPVAFSKVVESYYVTPPGSIIAFSNNKCPSGWVEYEPAYGRFIRGIDKSGNNVDPKGLRAPGDVQEDAVVLHRHDAKMEIGAEPTTGAAQAQEAAGAHGSHGTYYTSTGLVQPFGEKETRPKNISLLYCIKK